MSRALLTLTILMSLLAEAGAQSGVPKAIADVKIVQKLGEQVPLDAEFTDSDGTPVRFGDLAQGKPVVLVLAYYKCPRLCSVVISNVVDGLARISSIAGQDYHAIIVSFDPNEKPELAAKVKEEAVLRYGRGPDAASGWHFLTGQKGDIKRLADSVGFPFEYDPAEKIYKHAAGIMILTQDGKVARYLFGIQYAPQNLRLALLEASNGQIGSPVDNALLLTCFSYDPASGSYTLAIFKIVRVAAIITVLALGLYLWRSLSRERRQRRLLPPLPPDRSGPNRPLEISPRDTGTL